jgi:hypothetical protein
MMNRFPKTAVISELVACLSDHGALIIEGMLDQPSRNSLRAAIRVEAEKRAAGAEDGPRYWQAFHGANTKRFTGIGLISDVFFDLLEDEVLGALADERLKGSGNQYWMNTCQAMIIGPGEPAQTLHRDGDNWSNVMQRGWPDCPELTLSMILALDDVDASVGATRVIPGSHLWPDYERVGQPSETEPAELAAGDALIYSGKVIHGGGENLTEDRWRWALHLSFVVGWLTPEEAGSQIYSNDQVQSRSERVKRLLGFSAFNPYPGRGGRLWLKNFEPW